MNKKALELSINFIVLVIISLVVLGMGIYLVRMFVGQADEMKDNLDAKLQKQIEALLDSGDPVALPISRREIKRGKSDVFGLGIRNIAGEELIFNVDLEEDIYVSPEKDTSSWDLNDKPQLISDFETRDYQIENNDHQLIAIPVKAQGDKGTYVLNIRVTCKRLDSTVPSGCEPYGFTKAYIVIP